MTYHFTVFSWLKQWKLVNFISGPLSSKGGNFSHFDQFLWDLWKGTGDYWYHSMWPIILVFFSPTKTMEKIHFKHEVGKYWPWYWIHPWLLCRDRSAAACFYSLLYTHIFTIQTAVKLAQLILKQHHLIRRMSSDQAYLEFTTKTGTIWGWIIS